MGAWKVVRIVSGMVHAQLVKGRLESEGIPVILRYEAIGQIYAVTLNGLGEVTILVPEEYWTQAQEILSSPFGEGDE